MDLEYCADAHLESASESGESYTSIDSGDLEVMESAPLASSASDVRVTRSATVRDPPAVPEEIPGSGLSADSQSQDTPSVVSQESPASGSSEDFQSQDTPVVPSFPVSVAYVQYVIKVKYPCRELPCEPIGVRFWAPYLGGSQRSLLCGGVSVFLLLRYPRVETCYMAF